MRPYINYLIFFIFYKKCYPMYDMSFFYKNIKNNLTKIFK